MTVVQPVIAQHLDDAVSLRSTRSVLLRAPHVKLKDLTRADERLAAHLDGLSLAGEHAAALSRMALEIPGVGQIFVACVLAIERRDAVLIEHLISLLEAVPDAPRALASAFGWVAASALRGLTAPLLISPSPQVRWVGLAACVQHRVDPGAALAQAVEDSDLLLRTRGLRSVGELGRTDLLPACLAQLGDERPAIALNAARSAVLLGDRGMALQRLHELAQTTDAHQQEALALALFTASPDTARALVKQLAAQGTDPRIMIRAAGWSGDVQVMPWLFKQMEDKATTRLAGEAFSFITGIDLAWHHLHAESADDGTPGPNDDPADDNVALDEDDNVRWPDLPKITAWWKQNQGGYAAGTRYFAGATPSAEHCVQVLRMNTQRQRFAAAVYLGLLRPGSMLFNCAAPSGRQSRLLSQMVA